MTDAADDSLRRLFVPAAQAHDPSLEVEAREATPAGWVVSKGLRRISVIERMERHGHITHRQGCAGRLLYNDWSIGIMGARDREASSGPGSPGGYSDHQLDAARRYRMVRDRLGGRLFPIVYAVVLDDVSVPEYSKPRGLNPTSSAAVLRLALDIVGDAYQLD